MKAAELRDLGPDELGQGLVRIRDLEAHEEETVPRADVVDHVSKRLGP